MGILDSILGSVGGGEKSGNEGIMGVIGGLLDSKNSGGLDGLIQNFSKSGLGDTVSSWIGTGKNLPVSAEQIQSVLGNEKVQSIAKSLGISTEEASGSIATMLPDIIDKLTPDGKVPDVDALQKNLGGLLSGFGK